MLKILFLINILFFSQAIWSAQAEIDFLSQIYVDKDQIYLSDLTDKQKLPADISKQFENIVVAQAPKGGEARLFSNFAISEILRYNFKNQIRNYNIHIPNEITVYKKSNKITAENIKNKLISWVQPSCNPCRVEIQSLQIQNDGVIEPKQRWELPTTQVMPKGNFNISLDIYNDDNFVKKIFVQGNLRIYKDVPIAKRSLPTGTKIQKEDFALQAQDVTFARDTIPTTSEILGSETAFNVLPNQTLWKSSLKRRMALLRGAPVQVVMGDEGWQIRFTGIAQDSGYVGDIAKVLNPGTKKVITGIISDENLVEVR